MLGFGLEITSCVTLPIELLNFLDLVSITLACEVLGTQAVHSDLIIFEINILKLLSILQKYIIVAAS